MSPPMESSAPSPPSDRAGPFPSSKECLPSEEERVRMLRAVVAAANASYRRSVAAGTGATGGARTRSVVVVHGSASASAIPGPISEDLTEEDGPKDGPTTSSSSTASTEQPSDGDKTSVRTGGEEFADDEDDDEIIGSSSSGGKSFSEDERARRHRARLSSVLRDDLPRHAAEYLLLPADAVDEVFRVVRRGDQSDTITHGLEEGVSGIAISGVDPSELLPSKEASAGCVNLLLSNLVLKCCSDDPDGGGSGSGGDADGSSSDGGTYDARVRAAIKAACVAALEQSVVVLEEEEEVAATEFGDEPGDMSSEAWLAVEESSSSTANKSGKGASTTGDAVEGAGGTEKTSITSASSATSTTTTVIRRTTTNLRLRAATRKFESTEKAVACLILSLILASSSSDGTKDRSSKGGGDDGSEKDSPSTKKTSYYNKKNAIRAAKIGGAAVAAGTLLFVTGGMAAPGVVAGLTALGVGGAAAGALAFMTTTTAIVLFGVGGGGLAAYKMKRRTDGLTDFRVRREGVGSSAGGVSDETEGAGGKKDADNQKEDGEKNGEKDDKSEKKSKRLDGEAASETSDDEGGSRAPELRSTVCVSGWLRDKLDYQRPWGVTPTDPPLVKKKELLKRFFAIYDPKKVPKAKSMLTEYAGREDELWEELRAEYGGRDPDHTLPLKYGDVEAAALSGGESDRLADILSVVVVTAQEREKAGAKPSKRDKFFKRKAKTTDDPEAVRKQTEEIATFFKAHSSELRSSDDSKKAEALVSSSRRVRYVSSSPASFDDSAVAAEAASSAQGMNPNLAAAKGKTLTSAEGASLAAARAVPPVWDFLALYGSDLYTVTWESSQLKEVCDYMNDLALNAVSQASQEVAKRTAAATLFAAAALPGVVVNAMSIIDEPWTILSNRADEAGRELASCLLLGADGGERRPVTLVGYSFGARMILSCLRELERHQEVWEERRGRDGRNQQGSKKDGDGAKKSKRDLDEYAREPASIVEDVVLMGTPKYISEKEWRTARRVVGGRLVNCYSKRDWVLSIMFKRKNLLGAWKTPCGVGPIKNVPGVENHDVSNLIPGHNAYCVRVPHVLDAIGHGEPVELIDEHIAVASCAKA